MPRTDWLARQARYRPDQVALEWRPTGRRLTYADCERLGGNLASAVRRSYGIEKGDRVGVLAQNSLEHVLLFFAAQKAGWILVPLNYRLAAPEVQYLVADSSPKLLFVDAEHEHVAANLRTDAEILPLAEVDTLAEREQNSKRWPELSFDDPLMILYTSGTTGRPKGALYTHGMCFWNAVNTINRLDCTSKDVSFNAAPFYHTGGWNVLLTPFLLQGARTILLDRFDPDVLLRLCDDEGITVLWGVPTMLKMMSDADAFSEASLATVRYAIVGGEAMPEPLIKIWQDKGVPIRQGFGMTEVGPNCFSLPERDALRKIGSIGFPNMFIDTRIVDKDGNDVPGGATGELLMRGPVVTPGYWQNPEATDAAFQGEWFCTGDLVQRDEEGYFYVVGRKKEMYISGGENVYPKEIEAALYEHPAVSEAAVVGVPDPRWGETGMAFIVLNDGAELTTDGVFAHCRARLAGYKVPRHVRFVTALPKGHSGKIEKKTLQEEAAQLAHPPTNP